MSDAVKTLFNAALLTCSVSFVAILVFGNVGVIAAAFLVVCCSCLASTVLKPYLEKRTCGCTTAFNSDVPQKCRECLDASGTMAVGQTALYATPILIAILFVVAVTVGRRR